MSTRSELSIPSSTGEADFSERRKQLRQKRRVKLLQHAWQLLFIGSITGGMLWVATSPEWLLRSPNQIDLEGNRLLSQETLKKLIPVSYPQSIFQVQPQEIAAKLEATAPVHSVIVTRTLFPSRLTVQVQEREPVASIERSGQTWLIDAGGAWMPLQSYPANMPKPRLTVLGMNDRVKQAWPSLYRQISQSPVKISQIDWRDEANLVLISEIGVVYCGAYNYPEFTKQLETLDRLRALPQRLSPKSFTHIDLTDPKSPTLEMQSPSRLKVPADKP